MRRKTKTITVKVNIGSNQKVIVTSNPKSTQIPRQYFYQWRHQCRTVPVGYWARAGRKRKDGTRPEPILIKIDDMHPAQLWQCIKWCWRLAVSAIAEDMAKANCAPGQLLASCQKWRELLEAGRKMRLKGLMYTYSAEVDPFADYVAAERGSDEGWTFYSWYGEAIKAIDKYDKEREGIKEVI